MVKATVCGEQPLDWLAPKAATGGVVITTTWVKVLEPQVFVAVRVMVYVPSERYVCAGEVCMEGAVPSPKFQEYAVAFTD